MSNAKTETFPDCIVVLGMHRSGTSALAGMLSLLGCATPASMVGEDVHNEKGYFESKSIMQLSDQILHDFETQWNDWLPIDLPTLPAQKRSEHTRNIQQTLTDDFGEAPLFFLKDPRMCRMVPLWQDALLESGARVHFIHTHRNPQEVAASLNRRDGLEPAFVLLLWMRHVLDAEHATRGQPRIFTSYPELMKNWRDVAGKIDSGLTLRFPTDRDAAGSEIDAFLSQRLRHNTDAAAQTLANTDLPKDLRDTFAVMERWVASGEDKGDHAPLDVLRTTLNAQAAAFGPLVRPGQIAMLESAARQKRIAELAAELKIAKTKVKNLRAVVASKTGEIAKLNKAVAERDATLRRRP